jgi:hypothetical protein
MIPGAVGHNYSETTNGSPCSEKPPASYHRSQRGRSAISNESAAGVVARWRSLVDRQRPAHLRKCEGGKNRPS